ncbi:MAG: hypothetical protein AB9M60_05430 [Leptothrix sp. (in: b-proteobacteria)]
MRILPVLVLLCAAPLLVGCDALGIESGSAATARKEADGKAIGSACRHAMRAIEDCYTLNAKASKAAVYTGWMDMDAYMRENKIEGIAPVIPRKSAAPAAAASDTEAASAGESGAPSGHASTDAGSHGAPAEAPAAAHKAAKLGKVVAAVPREATTH